MSTTVNTTSANLYSRSTSDASKTAKTADAGATGQTAGADSVSSAAPAAKDGVALSSETGKSEKANPYAGVSENSSSVTVDGWKKGKNDSVEGILRNQGYSLKDIYTKDKDGKTLIDRVAETNGLKNPNVIHPGQNLQVPTREKSESLSSKDLKAGEEQTSQVNNKEAGVTTDSKMSRDGDGNNRLDVGVSNKENPNAGLSTTTTAPADGRIDSNSRVTESGTETNTVAMNGNGSAVTGEQIQAAQDSTSVTISDLDKNKNLGVEANEDTVNVTNPGNGKSGDVNSQVDISERSQDGFFENVGRSVNDFFFGAPEKQEGGSAQGASDVQVTRDAQGRATVTATVNGERKEIIQTAGDTDDSFMERVGSTVDGAASAVGNAASSAWDTVTGWFGGGGESETQKSEVRKSN